MKPASVAGGPAAAESKKSGTAVVKNAPPKETARIAVKPNFGNKPVSAKPVGPAPDTAPVAMAAGVAGVAAGVAAAGSKPKVAVAPAASGPVPVPAMTYEEPVSTTLTTALAGVLALLTWSTAGLLFASYLHYF
jgi:hypothetical protein